MKKYKGEMIRNLGLVAHGGAGKTSLAEAMLYTAGAIDRYGKVDDGSATMDYDPEEIKRKVSINAALAPCEWKDCKVNIVDTPGYFDFVGEVISSLKVVDSALVLMCAVSGVEVGTEKVWTYTDTYEVPRMVFINKMDRENANFQKVLDQARQLFGNSVIPMFLPIGAADSFSGIVDVVAQKAYVWKNGRPVEQEIPGDLQSDAETYREMLMESAAEMNDEYLMKYLEGEKLTDEELADGLKAAIAARKVTPVLCGSALKNIGISHLLDVIVSYFPAPTAKKEVKGIDPRNQQEISRKVSETEPFSAQVFKTMADPYVGKLTLFKVYSGVLRSDSAVYNPNTEKVERIGQLFVMKGKSQEAVDEVQAGDIAAVAKLQFTTTGNTLCDKDNPIMYPAIEFPKPCLSMAVEPKSKGDEDKISSGLARLTEEDPTFTVHKDTITGQTIISGLGDLHLEVITARLQKKFGAEVMLSVPKVPYKETIRGVAKVEGKHKKQSGGRGQYGHVWIEFEPLPPGSGFEFVDKIFGGAVPRQYIPAVEKGLHECIVEGVLAGYPVVDVRATLYDGSYHPVDSSEMAFKIAAALAFKKGMTEAKPVLLEPIMMVEVTVPEQYMGDIIGDLNKKRGKILGMEPQDNMQVIKAYVPQAEMTKYATDLRSMTQGRGSFTMVFDHYEELPGMLAEKVIAQAKKEKEEEE